MRLFSQTITAAVEEMMQVNGQGRTLVTLPSYEAPFMLAIAQQMELLAKKHQAQLELKIAFRTVQSWQQADKDIARKKGWEDTRGNLTYYRNTLSAQGKKLVVLCGTDKVTDTAGLEDFTFCDESFIWGRQGNKLFEDWLRICFDANHNTLPDDKNMPKVYDLLQSLRILPTGGLLQISDWLDTMNMDGIQNGIELLQYMLVRLDAFGLPNCLGFAKNKCRHKTFTQYAKAAQSFFDYTSFITPQDCKKGLAAVDTALEQLQEGNSAIRDLDESPEEVCPSYPSGQDFLNGLRRYIETENKEDWEKLRACDFVTLHDAVLRCRPPRPKTTKSSPHKLYGTLLDSLLTAMWSTLEQCHKKNKRLEYGQPLYLRLRGEEYYFTNESESSSRPLASELCQYAQEQLRHLIYGVDEVLEKYLREENGLCVHSQLMPQKAPRITRKAPFLRFKVEIAEGPDENALFFALYDWIIPEKHSDRLDAELIRRTDSLLAENDSFLPVYQLPYYEELLNAPDGDDTREILRHCLRDSADASFAVDLLTSAGQARNTTKDPLVRTLSRLAGAYGEFIHLAAQQSLIHALFHQDESGNGSWRTLKSAYENALQSGKELTQKEDSILGPLLMRAFLVTNCPATDQGANWCLINYEDSAIVTVLHPALLEQLHARIVFLCAAFRHIYQQASQAEKGFAPKMLQRYLQMSRMHAPLCTLLRSSGSLTSEVRGDSTIHKIGHVEHPQTDTLSTRLHSDGERFQEKLSDADLYAESEESALLDRLLDQYYSLRPHAADGISLIIFRNTSIQPIIAGVHSYLRRLDKENGLTKRAIPYDVRLIFFSKNTDAADLRFYLTHWKNRWEAAHHEESKTTNACYRNCHISVSHQIVRNSQEMENLIRSGHLDVDVAILYNLLDTCKTTCSFQGIDSFDCTSTELKYPILEKKYCVSRSESRDLSRSRVISLRQFSVGTHYTELLAALRQTQLLESSLVISKGNFHDWKDTITLLHNTAEWVICIDPAMDEGLIRDSAENKIRDIIAFGSGVGSHGEANYTVSSEQLSFKDLSEHVSLQLASLYGTNAPDSATCHAMAENLLHAKRLAGMALIRAASLKDTYIHDFLAYSLSRRLLQVSSALCDTMISLDAYNHWIAKNENRPDLLWITGEERDGRLHLYAKLIECKLAHSDVEAVWRGHTQLRKGLKILEPLFRPRGNEMDDDRPDRRYWWHQLHRVITSTMYAEQGTEAKRISALLEQLAEGKFSIEWEALLLTYWTDDDSTEIRWTDSWNINGVPAHQCVIGYPVQIQLALQDTSSILWEDMQQNEPSSEQEDCFPDDFVEKKPVPSLSDDDIFEEEEEDADDEDLADWERNYLPPEALDPSSVATPDITDETDQSEEEDNPTQDSTQAPTPEATTPSPDPEEVVAQENDNSPGAPTATNETITVQSESPRPGTIPEQILLGTNKNGQPVYWRFRDAVNRHLIIFGSSGNGKTYAIQCLLAELARQSLNSMVLDYSQSFTPSEILPPVERYFPESEQHFVVAKPLPINPLTRQELTQVHSKEPAYLVAGRITTIFKKIFNLGTQQVNILQDAVIDSLERQFDPTLQDVEHMLQTYKEEQRSNKNSLETVHAHIRSFVRTNPFTTPQDTAGWKKLYSMDPACNHVFQLASIPELWAAGIIEFVLWDLFFYAQRNGNPAHPSLIVLDEIQNLSLNSGSPVDKILREGRKFGIGLIAATQSLSGVKQSLSTLNQAAYKLYFRPADNEMAECGKQLYDVDSSYSATEWKELLSRLKRGECYIVGSSITRERPVRFVKIASMEERGFGN